MDNQTRYTLNRRNLIKASAAGVFAAALATSPLTHQVTFAQSAAQDLEILNYALTLEHLETKAYQVIIASGLLSGRPLELFKTFGAHEAAHVEALTATIQKLGGTPVKALASYNFPKLNNQNEVLAFFHTVEELGAAAYLGQAPRLMNPDLITAAVSIHNVEGQHAAVLADLIGANPAPAFAEAKNMEQVLQVVTPFLTAPAGAPSTMPTGMPRTGRGGYHRSGSYIAE